MARYGGNDVVIDDSEFQRKAKKLAREHGVDEREFIKEQTGLLARDAAKFTPPWASFPRFTGTGVGTAKDIKIGKIAIKNDLKKICTVIKDKQVINWAKKQKNGIYSKGIKVAPFAIDDEADLKRWHRSNMRGRGRTSDMAYNLRPWVYSAVFNKHLKKEQSKVGIAKASFVKASLDLGAKGTAPKAVMNNLSKPSGSGKIIKTAKGPHGVLSARAEGLFHTKRFLPQLMTNRLKKAVKRLQYIGRQSAKNAGFKTT